MKKALIIILIIILLAGSAGVGFVLYKKFNPAPVPADTKLEKFNEPVYEQIYNNNKIKKLYGTTYELEVGEDIVEILNSKKAYICQYDQNIDRDSFFLEIWDYSFTHDYDFNITNNLCFTNTFSLIELGIDKTFENLNNDDLEIINSNIINNRYNFAMVKRNNKVMFCYLSDKIVIKDNSIQFNLADLIRPEFHGIDYNFFGTISFGDFYHFNKKSTYLGYVYFNLKDLS